MAVDTRNEVNADPKLKTKAEKDRRLKEKQAANTKKIMDERKSMGFKENKESVDFLCDRMKSLKSLQAKTKLQNGHKKELEQLSKWIKVFDS